MNTLLSDNKEESAAAWKLNKGNLRGFSQAWMKHERTLNVSNEVFKRAVDLEEDTSLAYKVEIVPGQGFSVVSFLIKGNEATEHERFDPEPKHFALGRAQTLLVMDILRDTHHG